MRVKDEPVHVATVYWTVYDDENEKEKRELPCGGAGRSHEQIFVTTRSLALDHSNLVLGHSNWHWVIQTDIGSFKLTLDHWWNQIQGLEDSKLCGGTKIRCLEDANASLREFQKFDGSERMNRCNEIYVTMSSCV
ncbi:hypothetical protein WH47_00544 [Habropoda laboriosa]|uniref:Uncharacterized protein n=1 Tax=Habropoda laboriosa TaxID=597456 RepID=A0A0L7R421_9HYME|nr:hypothetical protein WH47_00544 [Habropoda laboriosa]